MFYGKVSQLDKKLTLPPELVMLSSGIRCTHQHLPFLHRYRPINHDQGVNEPG